LHCRAAARDCARDAARQAGQRRQWSAPGCRRTRAGAGRARRCTRATWATSAAPRTRTRASGRAAPAPARPERTRTPHPGPRSLCSRERLTRRGAAQRGPDAGFDVCGDALRRLRPGELGAPRQQRAGSAVHARGSRPPAALALRWAPAVAGGCCWGQCNSELSESCGPLLCARVRWTGRGSVHSPQTSPTQAHTQTHTARTPTHGLEAPHLTHNSLTHEASCSASCHLSLRIGARIALAEPVGRPTGRNLPPTWEVSHSVG